MQASTLKDAAETVTDTVSDLARTVAEMSPDVTSRVGDVTSKVGDTALRLAALTPWVEQATRSRSMRRWILMIGAVVAVVGVMGWLKTNRRNANDSTHACRRRARQRRAPPEGSRRQLSRSQSRSARTPTTSQIDECRSFVPGAGLEPASPFEQWCLRPSRLPNFATRAATAAYWSPRLRRPDTYRRVGVGVVIRRLLSR